jgi:hypothetical protein
MARPSNLEELRRQNQDRRLSYLGPEGEQQEEGTYNLNTFLAAAQSQPRELFDFLYRRQASILDSYQEVAAQLEAVQAQLEAVKTEHAVAKADFEEQLETLNKIKEDLIADRDMYMAAFARQQAENLRDGVRPTIEQDTPRTAPKSTKLPKGAKLSDGEDPTFESWLIDMRDSLESNKDHYETPRARIAFVKRMCEGKAANYLLPRLREDAVNPFRDAEDMFSHLKIIFQDVNRVNKAKDKLYNLHMKKNTHFQDFVAEFTQLAQESETPVSEWKNECYRKLNTSMQYAVMREVSDRTIDWEEFVTACHLYANRIEQIQATKERVAPRGNTPRAGSSQPISSRGATPAAGQPKDTDAEQEKNKPGWLDKTARLTLMKEGKCFRCLQYGHLARDCPHDPARAKVAKVAKLQKLEKEEHEHDEECSENE